MQVTDDLSGNKTVLELICKLQLLKSLCLQAKVDVLNAPELADTSWRSANSCVLLRTSDLDKDASYLRLSLGEFFGQRSEALGCLGGGSDVKRVCISLLRHESHKSS